MLRVRHNNLALVVVHHAVTTVIHDCQSLLAGISVGINPCLVREECLFGGGHVDIVLCKNVEVRIKAVSLNVLAEDLHVL